MRSIWSELWRVTRHLQLLGIQIVLQGLFWKRMATPIVGLCAHVKSVTLFLVAVCLVFLSFEDE